MPIGVPRVTPSNRPERISARSSSWRGVVIRLCPGRRRSRSRWICSTDSGRRGGQPSTTTPTPPPWDSPNVAIRKAFPKLLPTPGRYRESTRAAARARYSPAHAGRAASTPARTASPTSKTSTCRCGISATSGVCRSSSPRPALCSAGPHRTTTTTGTTRRAGQYVVMLSGGRVELEVGDGTKRLLGPGRRVAGGGHDRPRTQEPRRGRRAADFALHHARLGSTNAPPRLAPPRARGDRRGVRRRHLDRRLRTHGARGRGEPARAAAARQAGRGQPDPVPGTCTSTPPGRWTPS